MSTVSKLKVIEFLDGLYFTTIITSLYVISHGVSLYHAVIVQSVYSATVLLMEVPTGVIADKFSRKSSVALGYFMSVIGLGMLAISPTVIALYLSNIIRATGSALVSGANEAILYEASKEEGLNYKKQSSIMLSNGVAGLCVAGVIAGIAYARYGNRSFVPLILASVVIQMIMTLMALTLKDSSKSASKSIQNVQVSIWSILNKTYALMRKNKTIFALTAVGMLTVCNEYFLYGTYGPHFQKLGVSNFWVGAAFSLGLLANFVLQRNVYKIERFFTFEKALVIIKLGAILGYLALAALTQSTFVVITLIATIGVFNIEKPLVSDYVNQEIDNSIRATVLSGMSLTSRFSKMGLTLAMSAVIAGGSIVTGYFGMAVFLAVGLSVSYWLLVRCGCVRRFSHTT